MEVVVDKGVIVEIRGILDTHYVKLHVIINNEAGLLDRDIKMIDLDPKERSLLNRYVGLITRKNPIWGEFSFMGVLDVEAFKMQLLAILIDSGYVSEH